MKQTRKQELPEPAPVRRVRRETAWALYEHYALESIVEFGDFWRAGGDMEAVQLYKHLSQQALV